MVPYCLNLQVKSNNILSLSSSSSSLSAVQSDEGQPPPPYSLVMSSPSLPPRTTSTHAVVNAAVVGRSTSTRPRCRRRCSPPSTSIGDTLMTSCLGISPRRRHRGRPVLNHPPAAAPLRQTPSSSSSSPARATDVSAADKRASREYTTSGLCFSCLLRSVSRCNSKI